ncbi:MAG: type II toxin-antitoxin system HicB family antitoxin [Chloroflexota bacterium]|nr:type II toxin-antitoxin system HicB family antitoxin [Chloroflexota bacterium]MDE2687483.1 type II toxin-antitoxin system HicB family antitoxin [Chloroflexota bacterium]MYC08127.1 type II toxin-antitoxin system HicB family antitoxin [Chloroflexota bacterium]
MTKVMYKAEIFQEDDCFVGYCRELDVSSFGDTPEDAKVSLQEAIEAFLEGCEYLGTLDNVLTESGFAKFGDTWKLRERITEDKIAVVG